MRHKNGTYYLCGPVKDRQGIFRISVATKKRPTGPCKAKPIPVKSSYSIGLAVFQDADGKAHLYGRIRSGQLQHWDNNRYAPKPNEFPDIVQHINPLT